MAGPDLSLLSQDPSTMPQLDPPSVFSPFRFASIRETPGNESKYQFVTTSKEAMNFGHGMYSLPPILISLKFIESPVNFT